MTEAELTLTLTPTVAAFVEAMRTGRMPSEPLAWNTKAIAPLGAEVKEIMLVGPRGEGKALDASTIVLTPWGGVKIVDLTIGDTVYAADGTPTTILGVYPQGQRPLHRVVFSDGTSCVCTDDHLWQVETLWHRSGWRHAKAVRRRGQAGRRLLQPAIVPFRVIRERLESGAWKRGGRWALPPIQSIQFPARRVPIDPYLLGLLLGDGGLSQHNSVTFTTGDAFLLTEATRHLPASVQFVQARGNRITYYAVTRRPGGRRGNVLVQQLRALNLLGVGSHAKYVPLLYRVNTPAVRLALLQGLLDTDGTILWHSASVSYSTVSDQLADHVLWLVRSLGGVATKRRKAASWHVRVCLPNGMAPFRLPRKASRVREKSFYPPRKFFVSSEPAGTGEAVCIRVAHESGTFLIQDAIVTHNSWGVLCGVLAHAQAHEAAGFPLPVSWLFFRDTFPNQERNLLQDMKQPEWGGLWHLRNEGRIVTARMGGRDIVKAFVFGIEDQDAIERLRTRCVGIYGEEPAPAIGVGLGNGWTEAAWSLGLSSQGRDSHYKPAVVASNYPEKRHWVWRRFVTKRQPQCGFFRIQPGERTSTEDRERLGRVLEGQPAMRQRLFVGQPAPSQLGEPVVIGYREPAHRQYTPLPVAPGSLVCGWDFWHHPAVAIASLPATGQVCFHFAKRQDQSDVGLLVDEVVKPWLAQAGLSNRPLIHTGDPTGDDGDQSDRSMTAVRRLLAKLPGEWRPGTNDITKLAPAVTDNLRRTLSTGEPVLVIGPEADELEDAWSGGWHLNEHGKPVQHGEKGFHAHVGMAGAYVCFFVFGSGGQMNVEAWKNQPAYRMPWGGEKGVVPSAGSGAGRAFNAGLWRKQYERK